MQNDGLPVPILRNGLCDLETSAIEKRELSSKVDSFPELNDFYLKEDKSDIKFVINGTEIPAHKFVLSAKSSKFADLLNERMNNKTIDLDIESIDVFKSLLQYFYSEKFITDNETDYLMSFEVFKLAQKYDLIKLMNLIEQSLAKYINFDNYIEMLKFADTHQLNLLLTSWRSFVFINTNALISNELFLNESIAVIEKILFSLNVEQKYIILSIQKLIDSNPDFDVKVFAKLIHLFRCTVDDLVVIRQMALFDENVIFDELINRVRNLFQNCNERFTRRTFTGFR